MKKRYCLLAAFLLMATFANAQIVNIPDPVFKAKLLSALPANQIASTATPDAFGEVFSYNKIDTNNDGEIQVSEALAIKWMRISSSFISDYTGLNAFQNLINLHAGYNHEATTVDVSNLTNLKFLDFNDNNLIALDVSNLTNLKYLSCMANQLTTLDVSNLTALYHLTCFENQLTTLNFGGVTSLAEILCNNNLLTAIDISGITELTQLNCSYNQLTALDVSGLSNIVYIDCSENLLTTLNVNSLINLEGLNCKNNQLISLFVKTGKSAGQYRFENNPNLQYICTDVSNFQIIQSALDDADMNNVNYNDYCTFSPGGPQYAVVGNSRIDNNLDGCDSGDAPYANMKFNVTLGTTTTAVIADGSGAHFIALRNGTHTLTPIVENPSYFTMSPASVSVSFPSQASPFTQDFCLGANGNHDDMEVSIVPLGPARPGFDCQYKIIFRNKGTTTLDGVLNLYYNDAVLDFVSTDSPDVSAVPGILYLVYEGFAPFQTAQFIATFNANSPIESPALNGGNVLDFTVSISVEGTDETPDDNTTVLHQTVVNAFDPNDKTCLEGATITPEMVGKYVHYLIRFENTGTANAENIVVKDMIDTAKFDVSSLIPLDGSHPFVTRTSGNKVEFIFENINLPFDDAHNDGYVAFKIKTNPTLALGDTFSNTASIYFDYNFPIVTEPAVTAITALAKQDFVFDNFFRIYPNPADDVLKIESKQNIEVHSISIYNILGQLVSVVPNAKGLQAIDVSSLQAGNYFVKVTSDKGSAQAKLIKL